MKFAETFFKVIVVLSTVAVAISGCGKSNEDHNQPIQTESAAVEFERGPHNGRLLREGDFAVEITIFGKNVPPEFRVYVTRGGKSINPTPIDLSIQLNRFAGVVDQHRLVLRDDYLVSPAEVYELHSFDVTVIADEQGRRHRWTYAAHEGRTVIDPVMANNQGIEIRPAGAGSINERIALYGAIQPDATRMRSVFARFPGVIRSVDVAVGDAVRAGQTLAHVESNDSLQTYTVTSPLSGTVIRRHANPGETAAAEPLFEIADYSQVWAVLNVFPRDRARLQIGQPVAIRGTDDSARSAGTLATIGVSGDAASTLSARVVLDNRTQQWVPGQFITADVTVAETQVPVLVPLTALQTFRNSVAVFLNDGNVYQAQPVELGRRDGDNVEVTSGLRVGMPVVTANSYLVKADIEKSGASHDH